MILSLSLVIECVSPNLYFYSKNISNQLSMILLLVLKAFKSLISHSVPISSIIIIFKGISSIL